MHNSSGFKQFKVSSRAGLRQTRCCAQGAGMCGRRLHSTLHSKSAHPCCYSCSTQAKCHLRLRYVAQCYTTKSGHVHILSSYVCAHSGVRLSRHMLQCAAAGGNT